MRTPSPQSNPYAIERYPINPNRFIKIEFYKDGEQHRVWPYIGYSSEDYIRQSRFTSEGVKHFVVPGAFETQADAREAAQNSAQQYLAVKDWERYI